MKEKHPSTLSMVHSQVPYQQFVEDIQTVAAGAYSAESLLDEYAHRGYVIQCPYAEEDRTAREYKIVRVK